jgi:hypothetical protein
MSPPSDPINDTMDVDEFPELELLQQYFLKTSADNRLMLRKRVRELVPSLATLVEPGVKSRTRGQLKERGDMSIQQNASALELIQSVSVDSHLPSVTGDTMDVLQKSMHKQTGPMKEKVIKIPFLDVTFNIYIPFMYDNLYHMYRCTGHSRRKLCLISIHFQLD